MSGQETTTNSFTEEGRCLQPEYAIKGLAEAGTIAALACSDGVVLLGINPCPTVTKEKIYKLNDAMYCAVAGIFSDAHRLIKFARQSSANIVESIGKLPRPSVVCGAIAQEKQYYTQRAGVRPFGVAFLYCGHENNEYAVYSTDPTGTVNRWRAWAYGKDGDVINCTLRNDLPAEQLTMDQGVEALFKVLTKARENPPDCAQRMEVLLYKKEHARFMEVNEIERLIEKCEAAAVVK